MITVKNALQLPAMKNTKLVAGHCGMENNIKWVTIVEVLEDIERLQEGEFLITTGFELIEDRTRMEVFHNLLKSKLLSGVAIYTSFYMDSIPNSFIKLANENKLPLIEIPTDINFSKITKAILEQIINKQKLLLEQSEKVHRELTHLILNDQSLLEVTARLSQLTEANIIIFNEFHEIIYSKAFYNKIDFRIKNSIISMVENDFDISQYLIKSFKNEAKETIFKGSYHFTIYPIIAKQSCFGWIVMIKLKNLWQEIDDIAIERSAAIYALEFIKKLAVEKTRLQIQSNFLEDIFSENYLNDRIVLDQALKLNYDISLNQGVFHFTFERVDEIEINIIDRLYYIIEQLFIQKKKQHIMQTKLQSIILLTNIVGDSPHDKYNYCISLAKDILKEWFFYFPDINLIVGIGRDYHQIEQLGNSAVEAQYAIQLRDLIKTELPVYHYEDLGMYDLLLNMKQSGMDLKTIYEENISELVGDSDKDIDLIETIEVYFQNNQSIQDASEQLFIHRHTLRYRLNQIEKRTNLDIKLTDDRLKLQLSVMAYRLVTLLENKN